MLPRHSLSPSIKEEPIYVKILVNDDWVPNPLNIFPKFDSLEVPPSDNAEDNSEGIGKREKHGYMITQDPTDAIHLNIYLNLSTIEDALIDPNCFHIHGRIYFGAARAPT